MRLGHLETDSRLFVKSPKTADKTRSLKLYPQGCNQWQVLQELSAYYGLSGRQQDKEEARQRIQRQQAEERKRAGEGVYRPPDRPGRVLFYWKVIKSPSCCRLRFFKICKKG